MKLTNKNVFITGGTGGIGLRLAEVLAKKGNRVIVCGRNADMLALVKTEHSKIDIELLDINDINADIKFKELIRKYNKIDILVNNAGIQERYFWSEDFYDYVKQETDVNYLSCVRLINVFLRQKNLEEKAIVNITSLLGIIPKKSAPSYCASKAAMHVFTKAIRYQMTDTGLKVYDVLPPLVATGMSIVQSGERKMSVIDCVNEIVCGIEKDHYEIKPDSAKILAGAYRVIPGLIDKIMSNK